MSQVLVIAKAPELRDQLLRVALEAGVSAEAVEDFEPVGLITEVPMVLAGRKSLEANSMPELLAWLKEVSRRTGLPVGRIIRQQLESAKSGKGNQRFLQHAGKINGSSDLSSRKGFSRR